MAQYKILIIEDDSDLAATIKNFFKVKGFQVHVANDGAVGVQMAFSVIPDIVLCDINIPIVDGYQVYNILNETPQTYSVPFIFLTAKTSLKEIRTGMQMGADDYITKPFEFDDLYKTVLVRIDKRQKILKNHEDKFISLINNSPYGAFVCQDGKIILSNNKLTEYLAVSQYDLLQKCISDFVTEHHVERVKKIIEENTLARSKHFELEFDILTGLEKKLSVKMIGGISYYNGSDCLVGSLVNLNNSEYTLKDIELSSAELEELGQAIELFSSDYNLISMNLIQKLSSIYKDEKKAEKLNIDLSVREMEVLEEICKGKSSGEIAGSLFISERTVEKHRGAIVQKLGARNMIEAVILAIKNKLVSI